MTDKERLTQLEDQMISMQTAHLESERSTVDLMKLLGEQVGRLINTMEIVQKNQDMMLALIKQLGGIKTHSH